MYKERSHALLMRSSTLGAQYKYMVWCEYITHQVIWTVCLDWITCSAVRFLHTYTHTYHNEIRRGSCCSCEYTHGMVGLLQTEANTAIVVN